MQQNEPPPQDVVELCRETFKKTAEYLKGELEGSMSLLISFEIVM